MYELLSIIMGLSIENQKRALSFVKGLAKNSGYYVSNDRQEAIKRLVLADIPMSEENIHTYLDESRRYSEALKRCTPKIEKYPLICKVKEAIEESRKATVGV